MDLNKIQNYVNCLKDPRWESKDQVWTIETILSLIERIKAAEIVMDHLKWCISDFVDDCPKCLENYNGYKKKWVRYGEII